MRGVRLLFMLVRRGAGPGAPPPPGPVLMGSRRWYPWLQLGDGAHWPRGASGRDLLRRLNRVGRECRRTLLITSGRRTNYEQWLAYMDYLRGGTLAAPCCSRQYVHEWSECLRDCRSRHCASSAADVVVIRSRGRGTVNIGESKRARKAMRRNGLCLPVGSGETWHVEVGDSWLS